MVETLPLLVVVGRGMAIPSPARTLIRETLVATGLIPMTGPWKFWSGRVSISWRFSTASPFPCATALNRTSLDGALGRQGQCRSAMLAMTAQKCRCIREAAPRSVPDRASGRVEGPLCPSVWPSLFRWRGTVRDRRDAGVGGRLGPKWTSASAGMCGPSRLRHLSGSGTQQTLASGPPRRSSNASQRFRRLRPLPAAGQKRATYRRWPTS